MLKKIILKWQERKIFATALVIFLRVVSISIGFVFIKTYTNNLSTDQIGKYFYLVTLSYVMNSLVFVPIDYYLQARLALSEKNIPLGTILNLNRRVCLLAFFLCLSFGLPLWYMGKIEFFDLFGIYLTAFLFYICNFSRGLLNNRGHKIFVVNMLIFESILKIVLFLAAVMYFNANAELLLYSTILAFIFEILIIGIYFSKKIAYSWNEEDLEDYKTVFRKCYALSIGAICNLVQLQLYRLMYVWVGAPATAAIYTVVSNLGASGMTAISSVYAQLFLPKVYVSKGKYTLTYIRNALLLTLLVVISALIFGKYVLLFLTKDDYVEYAHAIGFGVLIEAGNMVIGAATVFLMMNNAAKLMIFYNVVAAISSTVGGFIVMTHWPQDAFLIGIPIVLSQIFIATFLIWHVAKINRMK